MKTIIALILSLLMSLFSFGTKNNDKPKSDTKPAPTSVKEEAPDDPLGPPIYYDPETDMYVTPNSSWPAH